MSLYSELVQAITDAGVPAWRRSSRPVTPALSVPYAFVEDTLLAGPAHRGDGKVQGATTSITVSLFLPDDGSDHVHAHLVLAALDGFRFTADTANDGYRSCTIAGWSRSTDPAPNVAAWSITLVAARPGAL